VSVPFKSFTVTITPVSQFPVAGVLGNPVLGEPVTALVYAEPQSATEMYNKLGVDIGQGVLIMCEIVDASKFTPNAEVQISQMTSNGAYVVVGEPMIFAQGLSIDHAEIVLRFKQYLL
jgi:hypothetical protein